MDRVRIEKTYYRQPKGQLYGPRSISIPYPCFLVLRVFLGAKVVT